MQILMILCRHDFPLVFGVDCHNDLSKADRLIYGESSVTHAMVFTAIDVDVSSFPSFVITGRSRRCRF